MKKTPTKKAATAKVQECVVCVEIAKYPRKVDSTRSGANKIDDNMNTRDLLLKYGGIHVGVDSGTICRACWDKLAHLHKKVKTFYEFCQSKNAVRQEVELRGKCMPPSVPSPPHSVHSRPELTNSPESLSKDVSAAAEAEQMELSVDSSAPSVYIGQDLKNTQENLSKDVSKEIKTEKIENEGPLMIPFFDKIENISGKPSDEKSHPDFVPNQNLTGKERVSADTRNSGKGQKRAKKRKLPNDELPDQNESATSSISNETESTAHTLMALSHITHVKKNSASQTTPLEAASLIENEQLRDEVQRQKGTIDSLKQANVALAKKLENTSCLLETIESLEKSNTTLTKNVESLSCLLLVFQTMWYSLVYRPYLVSPDS